MAVGGGRAPGGRLASLTRRLDRTPARVPAAARPRASGAAVLVDGEQPRGAGDHEPGSGLHEEGFSKPPPLLSMPPARAVWTVGWPSIAQGLLSAMFALTDSFWAGRMGSAQLSALGGTAFAVWIVQLLCALAPLGTHSSVSASVGAGDRRRLAGYVVQGLWAAGAVAVLLAFCAPAAGSYCSLLGLSPASPVHVEGTAFLSATLVSAAPLAASRVLEAAFRGLGLTRVALCVTAFTVVLNMVLDPLLMWGVGPLPRLGVAGAAWGTSISTAVGTVLFWFHLRRAGVPVTAAKPCRETLGKLLSVGLPLTGSGLMFSATYVVIGRIASGLDSANLAALGLGHRFEAVPYVVCEGFRIGAATLVGQWLGAGDRQRARDAADTAARLCCWAVLPIGVVMFAFAPQLLAAFATDPAILKPAVEYVRLNALVFGFMAAETVYEGAFTGLGNTVPTFWFGLFGNAARLALSCALVHAGFGIHGVWAAIIVSQVAKGFGKAWWFRERSLPPVGGRP